MDTQLLKLESDTKNAQNVLVVVMNALVEDGLLSETNKIE